MRYAREHGYVAFTHDLDFGTLLALTRARPERRAGASSERTAGSHRRHGRARNDGAPYCARVGRPRYRRPTCGESARPADILSGRRPSWLRRPGAPSAPSIRQAIRQDNSLGTLGGLAALSPPLHRFRLTAPPPLSQRLPAFRRRRRRRASRTSGLRRGSCGRRRGARGACW